MKLNALVEKRLFVITTFSHCTNDFEKRKRSKEKQINNNNNNNTDRFDRKNRSEVNRSLPRGFYTNSSFQSTRVT
jgi:hypothetical protein